MQILTMIKNQLKLLFNNRIAIFGVIAAPLLLTFLFSFSSGNGKTNLYITDLDNSVNSKQLVNMIKNHKDINVVSLSENDLKKKVDNSSISMGFIIDKNFGDDLVSEKKLDIKMLENYETGDGALLEQVVLSEANTLKKVTADSKTISDGLKISNDNVSKQLFEKIKGNSNISTDERSLNNSQKKQDATTVKLIGFLVMFLWFVIVQGFRTLIEEKSNNTFERILGTPTNYTKYLISKIAATYIFGLIVTVIILIAGKYLFNINLITNLPAEAVIFAVYLFALTGIIMIFVPFIKRQQSFTILGAILMALTGILGGSFFSIDEIASGTMKLISRLTPESWAIKSLNDVFFNSAAISSELPAIIVLAAAGVLGLAISYVSLNIKIKGEKA
ncbi:MAG: ABC transporter permease [Bacillota bacterium]|nr:ABC transporter permease [Bacillota bacterium]